MGWFRGRGSRSPGYEDRAALKGFGGYEPNEPHPPTVGPTPRLSVPPTQPTQHPGSALPTEPGAPPRRARRETGIPLPTPRLLGFVLFLGFAILSFAVGSNTERAHKTGSADAPATAPVVSEPVPETRVVVPAAVDGWEPVVQREGAYAYDVPPDWTPRPGTIHGWETEGTQFTLVTSAFVGERACGPDEHARRGGSGLTAATGKDAATAVTETAETLARHAYTPDGGVEPDLEVVERRSVEVSIGGRDGEAELVLAEVTVADAGECLPRTALVGALAVAVPDGDSVPVLLAYDGQDGPDATSKDDMVRLLTSLRSVPENERETTVVTPTP
ncbi:hypothetical protein SacxiDRAFT_0951 [Saccharomonospora xinjiangensis XJ-54]|uniref:DUF8017 domain-containing protein n=1 Tax=Saccharomonospora xinjiangensis XJ-54 TaxID=882086 RepID=I0UZB2_9PSEU|nr:hypothetical protein SacxiDRAFT_0951 [Saccharomonospora xinjiangensis XJ-54]